MKTKEMKQSIRVVLRVRELSEESADPFFRRRCRREGARVTLRRSGVGDVIAGEVLDGVAVGDDGCCCCCCCCCCCESAASPLTSAASSFRVSLRSAAEELLQFCSEQSPCERS